MKTIIEIERKYERVYELVELIETLENDLRERPKPKEFAYDFERDMMQKALTDAKNELRKLTTP